MKGKKANIASQLRSKAEQCVKSRKNANCLVDILVHLQEEDTDTITAGIKSVHRIFSHFLDVEEMCLTQSTPGGVSNEDKYKVWLQERYLETVKRLLELLQHDVQNIKELSLTTLLRLMQKEMKHPFRELNKPSSLPVSLLKEVLTNLLADTVSNQPLFTKLQEYLVYDDVRYFTLKQVLRICEEHERLGNVSDVFLENMFALLDNLCMPVQSVEKPLSKWMSSVKEKDHNLTNLREHRRLFTETWVQFLQFKLPSSLYRRVLIGLHDKVIPHMSEPLLLSDFLTVSYNIGGAISLLSLNSLFILIHKHNLDYPDFYKKLYALFEPTIFHAKYRSRFFYLSNLFLSSTHLPAYMVAAFAKRLARISLTAPFVALKLVIPFIYNLINRHPICKQLVHRPNMESDMVDDPFLPDETDPAKCKAIDSCLWELQTLQQHFYPEIVYSARKMEHNLPEIETDLSELLDTTADEIFENECSKKVKRAPVTFDPPKGLFGCRDDKLKLCWTL